MNAKTANVKTIDVRGLEHEQRQLKIFPAIEKTQKGESILITFEFNPLPLAYMLESRNEFDISYDKEGPEEWILRITRTAANNTKEDLKKVLQELREGEISDATKARAKKLFQTLDAKTLGLIEQELISEGISHEEIRENLCDIHLEVLRDSLVSKRIEVKPPHPIHTLMEEHKVILESLQQLGKFISRLKSAKGFEEVNLEELREIAHHLVDAESHHQREEEVLFPRLETHDITEPPLIMMEEHVEFRKRKKGLYKMAHNARDYDFEEFKREVIKLGEYLAKELESHIFKEDNILYQIALQVLTEKEWEDVKEECDKIGYCCFTPGD